MSVAAVDASERCTRGSGNRPVGRAGRRDLDRLAFVPAGMQRAPYRVSDSRSAIR